MNFSHIVAWTIPKKKKGELEKRDPLFTPGPTQYNPKDIHEFYPAWKIGSEKRGNLLQNTKTPEPGKYEYKSFIGEGPKYTMRERYSIDGTKKEKRHKKAYRKKSFPGPGTYNVREDFVSGPRYTMSAKYRKIDKRAAGVPGVGTYNLRKDADFLVDGGKWDTQKRKNGNINEKNLKFPGPGSYNITADGMSTVGPKFSFGKSQRLETRRPVTPGPGTYAHKLYVGKEGPKYTINKEPGEGDGSLSRSKSSTKPNTPAPGDYFQSIQYRPDSASFTISKSLRPDETRNKWRMSCPGPEKYNPKDNVSSKHINFPSWKFSGTKRDDASIGKDRIKNPAPGQYNVKNGTFPEGVKYTISKRLLSRKGWVTPGPGAYQTVVVHHENEPKYSFPKGNRSDDVKRVKKNNYPGVGSYNYKDSELTKPITFPKGKKSNELVKVPGGPGMYRIPCRFNDINNMTREKGVWDPTFKWV